MEDAPRLRTLLPAGAVAVVLSFCVYWPAIVHGGFLSDDPSIVGFLLDPAKDPPAVDWNKVALGFQREWMGGRYPPLYRPMVTLSFALDYALAGGSGPMFHFTNALIHGVVSMLCGLLCGICVTVNRWRVWATLLGGALFAVHPIGHEVVCWLSARSSGLEVMFRLCSMVAFGFAMYRPTVPRYLVAGVAAVLALMTKETAVMLPVCYLALDLLIRPHRPLMQRVRLHLAWLPLWLGYFLARWILLPQFLGDVGGDNRFLGWLSAAGFHRFTTLLLPRGDSVPLIAVLFIGATVAWFLLLNVRSRQQLLVLVGGLLWMSVLYLPSQGLGIHVDLFCSRYVYGSLVVLTVVMMRLFFASGEPFRYYRRIGVVLLAAAMAGMVVASRARLDKYAHCWEELQTLHGHVDEAARSASEARPLVMLIAQGSGYPAVPFLHVQAMYSLAERPFAAADHPFVGLGCANNAVVGTVADWDLNYDMAPVRALWHQRAWLYVWQPDRRNGRLLAFGRVAEDHLGAAKLAPLEREPGNRFLFRGGPISPFQVEALRIATDPKVTTGRLSWLARPAPSSIAGGATIDFRDGEILDGQRVFQVDLSHHRLCLVETELPRALGPGRGFGLVGFAIEVGASPVRSVEAVYRLPVLDLPRRLQGETVPLSDVLDGLVAPALPPGMDSDKVSMQLVLMSAMYPIAISVAPGQPVRPGSRHRQHLADMCNALRVDCFYYYFATVGSPLNHRSEVGWFVLDGGPAR